MGNASARIRVLGLKGLRCIFSLLNGNVRTHSCLRILSPTLVERDFVGHESRGVMDHTTRSQHECPRVKAKMPPVLSKIFELSERLLLKTAWHY